MACTHLHWDHSGGVCKLDGGRYSPTFANARHVFQKGEWNSAIGDDSFHKASYAAPSLLPVQQSGLLQLVDGDADIAPGVRFEFTNGHTEHHAVIWIEDAGESACFLGDLVPMSAQVPVSWISAYDSNAVGSFHAREALYARIMAKKALCLFYHEPAYPVGRLVKSGEKYSAELLA
jgi:glyoxylase-like metal-dependent hydrolase (beta-lactamase superfamily II)